MDPNTSTATPAASAEPTLFDVEGFDANAAPASTAPAAPAAPIDPASLRPDWFPEDHWKEGKPDLDGFKEAAKSEWLAARPEAADKYVVPKIEGVPEEEMTNAPIMEWWRETAFARGLSQDDFQKGVETYLNQLNLNGQGFVAQEEAYLNAERAKLGENANARLQTVGNWVKETFQGEELESIMRVGRSAAGISVLERIMTTIKDGGGVIPKGADFEPTVSSGPNEEEIKALMQDRRYWQASMRDPAVVAKVNAFYDQKYGKRG
jgi:hypothetical protein